MRLRYSFVIDDHPRFLAEGEIFLRTLLASGVAASDVVAQVTGRSSGAGKSLAARFGVRAIDLPLGPDEAYCSKINQLFTLADDDFDVLVACDTGLAILSPLDQVARAAAVRARRVDLENPPLQVLEKVRLLLDFPEQPPLVPTSCAPDVMTYALNCNGAMLFIPRRFMQSPGETRLGYAHTLVARRQLMERWANHIDQVTWAFAMLRLQLPFEELPVEYNFSTRLAKKIPRGYLRSARRVAPSSRRRQERADPQDRGPTGGSIRSGGQPLPPAPFEPGSSPVRHPPLESRLVLIQSESRTGSAAPAT